MGAGDARQHAAARDEAQPRARLHARRPDRRRPAQAAPARAGHARCAGTRADLARVLRELAAGRGHHRHALAPPGAVRQEIFEVCRAAGSPVHDAAGPARADHRRGRPCRQLREVRVEDVLGRAPVRARLRADRPLPQRPRGAGHRRRRLDRPRAVPPGRRAIGAAPAGDGGPRREQPLRGRPAAARARPRRPAGAGDRRLQGRDRDGARVRPPSARRSSSTPPPTSTCR